MRFGNEKGFTDLTIHLTTALLVAVIFYMDLLFPLGVAVGSLYIVAVVLAFWSPHPRLIPLIALLSSMLVIAGYLLGYDPHMRDLWKVLFNRGLALVIIWITALLCLRIKRAEQELVRVANHDFLTGLLNRREMFNRLHTEMCRIGRIEKPFSVIMLDIDNFKNINDRYGHHAGDRILKETARILKDHLREYDYICRYGGEEFLVAAPETPLETARELAERLRRMLMEATFQLSSFSPISITLSAGVAQQLRGEAISTLISRADSALYRAKRSGRNQVVTFSEA